VTQFAREPVDEDDDGVEWVSDPDEVREHLEEGESPIGKLRSLRDHMLEREPARFFRWLDAELANNPRVMSAERWPEDVHMWRAYLAAACLEIVTLDEAGAVDRERLQATRADRFVHITHAVHDLAFEECLEVFHTHAPPNLQDHAAGSLHVDVYAYRDKSDIVLVTGGMSMVPMGPHIDGIEDRFLELVCVLPGDTDDAPRLAVTRALREIATVPARRGTHFAVNHTVELDAPFVEGSALRGFILVAADDRELTELFSDLLPKHPSFLLAVGLDAAELEHRMRVKGGRAHVAGAAATLLGGRTLPLRTRSII